MTAARRANPDWPAEPRRVVVTGMGMLTALGRMHKAMLKLKEMMG